MSDSRPYVSLVIPAFNEERSLASVIERCDWVLERAGFGYEIIVVNDGSLDDTLGVARDCAMLNGHVKVYSYKRNKGKGHAVKTGFGCARGDCVVFMDGDMEIRPGQIGFYLEALRRGDVVIGSKNHPESRVVRPPMRMFLSLGFNWLVRLLTGLEVRDTQSGLKAVRREPLERVFSVLAVKRFAFDVELLAVSRLYGLRIVEAPIEVTLTRSVFPLREVLRMLVDLLAIKWRLVSDKYLVEGVVEREGSLVQLAGYP